MSINGANTQNLNKNLTSTEALQDSGVEIISGDVSTETIDSKGRIGNLRSGLGFGEYSTEGRAMVSGTIYKDESQHTQTKNKYASFEYEVVGEIPPPPRALDFWPEFYARGKGVLEWDVPETKNFLPPPPPPPPPPQESRKDPTVDEDVTSDVEVLVVGGWKQHSLGDLIGDAGGIAGLDNGMGTANVNTKNDSLFKSVYNKMSEEDKEKLATTSLVINVDTGEVIGESEAKGESWGDAAHKGDTPNNSIEGKNIKVGDEVYKVAESTFRWSSPIILDMDGDGIELTSNEDGTVFDIDGDGKQDKTSWTKSGQGFDDAFLVLDKNKNGEIDSGKELFGDQNGSANGYDELAKLDSNKDGTIDTKDAAYKELQVWADLDGDGKVGNGELKSLEETGVTSISTQNTGTVGEKQDQHGNDISLESTFTRNVDGEEKTLKTVDAFFTMRSLNDDANSTRSTIANNASISPDEINASNAEKQAERFRKISLSSKLDEAEANKQAYESELSSVESEVNNTTSKSSTVKITKPASSEDEETEAVNVSSSEDDTAVLSRKDSLTADISSIDSEIENLRSQIG
jgi:hypothetical protein